MTTTLQVALNFGFPEQRDFVAARDPFTAFVAGAGSGKTHAGVGKDFLYAATHPGSLGMVTAPTFSMLMDATFRKWQEIAPPESYTWHVGEKRLELVNGSEILWRSTDDPEHLRGPTLDWVHMDEAARSSEDAFNILIERLRPYEPEKQLWITTTPKGYNWVYHTFGKEERHGYRHIHCSARANIYLDCKLGAPDGTRSRNPEQREGVCHDPDHPHETLQRMERQFGTAFALQEIEGEYTLVDGDPFFETEALRDLLDSCEIPRTSRTGGAVRIWRPPAVAGKYIAGGDLAWGETGAYSCLHICDWNTMDQVAQIHGRLKEDEMAALSVKLCQQYNNAYAGLENNGLGKNVLNKMVALGYGSHMYWEDRAHDKPGWHTAGGTTGSRVVMLGELEEAVRNMTVRPRAREDVQEMMTFVRDEKGNPNPSPGMRSDRVMAWAITVQMRKYARFSSAPSAKRRRVWSRDKVSV